MTNITKQEIGKRIAHLRQKKGYSQESLAKIVDISRTSVTQIELGKRNINIFELKKLSDTFAISIDKLLSTDYKFVETISKNNEEKINAAIRESIPKLNLLKSKAVLIYVLDKCAAKHNFNEDLLHLILYLIDFNYYELFEEHLSGAAYRKLSHKPISDDWNNIIDELMKNSLIDRFVINNSESPKTRYLPNSKPDLRIINANELILIDKIIDLYSEWKYESLLEFLIEDMPLKATSESDIIDYELAFYREFPYSMRQYSDDSIL